MVNFTPEFFIQVLNLILCVLIFYVGYHYINKLTKKM